MYDDDVVTYDELLDMHEEQQAADLAAELAWYGEYLLLRYTTDA